MTAPDGLALSVEALVVHGADGRNLMSVPRLTVPAGQHLAIKGPSGAGKSTLLLSLAGLLQPAGGCVMWSEIDLWGLTEGARCRFRRDRFGLIFQDHHLFEELSAVGNVSVAAAFAPAHARAALRRDAVARLMQMGLTADPRQGVRTFSGGERQRIAVARALAHNPAVILADEPTASLDRATADRLIDDLAAEVRARGCSLITVTHDVQLTQRADRILTIENGQIVADTHG